MKFENWQFKYGHAQNVEFKDCKDEKNFVQSEDDIAQKIAKINKRISAKCSTPELLKKW